MPLLLDWFLQPLGLVFSGLLIGQLWLFRVPQVPAVLRGCLTGATLLLWLCSAPLSSNALVGRLEQPSHQSMEHCDILNVRQTSDVPIVVLGADLDAYVASDNPYEVLSNESLMRIRHALSLDMDNSTFYLMGGGQTSRKLSDFMARVLIDQGVEGVRIKRDTSSLSTLENAQQLTSMLEPGSTGPIILVTSALHMNRSVSIFADYGFSSCPGVSGSLYSVSAGWVGLLPYINGLSKTTAAWRELLATIKYKLVKSSREQKLAR